MKTVFLTEMGFEGKVPANHSNMRTEFAWMYALDADHKHLNHYREVAGYDHVFIIFPKGKVFLSAEGTKLSSDQNPVSGLLRADIVNILKEKNKLVHYVQEGPHWWFNDYEIPDQVYFYNLVASCDSIFAHNISDVRYYKGLYPGKEVRVIPTLMIDSLVQNVVPEPQDLVIVGGNFARWYGGFESYTVATVFNVPVWTQTSHAMRPEEALVDGIQHLPRLMWTDWMEALSKFKYAVHLMPTVAAGTFSLNCAYLGIPCIGNKQVDTQRLCHPQLAVEVNNLEHARIVAKELLENKKFYKERSEEARENYKRHYSLPVWLTTMHRYLDETK